ncbi:hypothetical protein DIPPA_15639 [Diplonema papillatum]|nr:hypothetical protein DIPPA_20788 [Diplonema papillatum]KAJ9438064.1 hypothetical protein DIPPA_15639 [Diplonema papillatum]
MARVDPRSGTMLVFNHDPWRRLTAFRMGEHDRAVVVIGGQRDTFFLPELHRLARKPPGY